MTDQTVANTGQAPGQMLADAGSCSADNLDTAAAYTNEHGTEFYIATGRQRRDDPPPVAPRGRNPKHATSKQRTARKLATKNGQQAYARRKAIVEPVFGQMHTLQNAKHLLLRGLGPDPRVFVSRECIQGVDSASTRGATRTFVW